MTRRIAFTASLLAALAAATISLSACGSGDDSWVGTPTDPLDPPPAPSQVHPGPAEPGPEPGDSLNSIDTPPDQRAMPTDLNGQAAGQAGAELVRDELAPQFESVTGNCNATAYAFLTDRCSHATVTRAVNTNGWVTVYIDDTHIYR